jgi:hypothetical protein
MLVETFEGAFASFLKDWCDSGMPDEDKEAAEACFLAGCSCGVRLLVKAAGIRSADLTEGDRQQVDSLVFELEQWANSQTGGK